jgi:hypothetical protein
MRKVLVWFLVLGLVVSLSFLAGCGDNDKGEETGENNPEAVQEDSEMAGEAEEGEAVAEEGEEGGEEANPGGGEGETAPDNSGSEVPSEDEIEEIIPDISRDIPTEEQLGAPIYPGAAYVPESGGSMTGTGPEGELSVYYAEFTTGDSFDKVAAFYEGRLGKPQQKDATVQQAVWMLNNADGTITVVGVNRTASGLIIGIGRTTGDMDGLQ